MHSPTLPAPHRVDGFIDNLSDLPRRNALRSGLHLVEHGRESFRAATLRTSLVST